ncbi:MAG: GTPase [Micavibrio sp.]|nr:GTPase [Micavibrio sp.]|tara:strand:+ start:874 stop:1923 length:1050 start_codon:yes stop_codon:yes gene_type:complete
MRLKSFYAKNMTEAMQMIRDTLGEDAIIVATREERGERGTSVRVTAAIDEKEPAFELGKGGETADASGWLQYDDEEEDSAVVEQLTDVMIRHGVPEEVTDQILSYATVMGYNEPLKALIAALETLFTFRPLHEISTKNRFLFIGPPGAGKTITTAKFAAQAVIQDKSVAVITTDLERAGATHQLKALTDLMDIQLEQARTAAELKDALLKYDDVDLVYIDSPGVNPFDPKSFKQLAKLLSAGNIEPVLVLPAGTDPYESEDLARIYATIGTEILIPTRLDMARRYGGLLSAAHSGNLCFAESGISQSVADGLERMTPKGFATYLLPPGKKITGQPKDNLKKSSKKFRTG